MKISAITAYNNYPSTPENNLRSEVKLKHLQQDTFQPQKKFNPAFGSIIALDDISPCLLDLAKKAEEFSDLADPNILKQDASFLFAKLTSAVNKNTKSNLKGTDKFINSGFIDDVTNKCNSLQTRICAFPQTNTASLKKQIQDAVKVVEFCTNKWMTFEKWLSDPVNNISAGEVLGLVKQMQKSLGDSKNIILEGEKIEDCIVQDPVTFFNLFSQAYIDITKHSKDGDIKAIIKSISQNHRKDYYAYLKSNEGKPIPDGDPKQIFRTLVAIVEENGYANDVKNLIQREEKGVCCIRVPLAGLNEPISGCTPNYFSSSQTFLP